MNTIILNDKHVDPFSLQTYVSWLDVFSDA